VGNWEVRAKFYHWFRCIFPINLIFDQEIDNALDLLDRIPKEPESVLDLGTGIGDTLQFLPTGKKRLLLDYSFEMLSKAKVNGNDKKVVGNLVHLPLKKNNFDLITCIGVSEYIQPKAVLLHEIYECLQPDGYALITFSPKNMFTRLRKLLGKKVYPLSGSTAYDLIAAQKFFVVWVYKSTMQSQYLLQKII
jgi:ubiquinone/menaquinone biosynthesis C-methylase UbiE